MSTKTSQPIIATLSLFAVHAACVLTASASTIVVPPVTISELTHAVSNGTASDGVAFPDISVASDGFSAAVGSGDTVVIRFQAPPAKKFVIHGGHGQPGLPEEFFVNGLWSAASGLVLQGSPNTLSFADPDGVPPTVVENQSCVSMTGTIIFINFKFLIGNDFAFTALDIKFVVANSLTATSHQYSGVQSKAVPSWGTQAPTPDATLMEIVDGGVVPTTTTSWGQVKSRYR